MANYHSVKNAAILTPSTNTDLGSDANRYSNVYMSGNIVMSNGVTVTSTNAVAPRVTSIAYPGNDTAADPAGGQTITLNGSGFVTGANVLISGSVTNSTSVVNSSTITFISPALNAGSYVIYVINADGSTAISIPGIQYSGVPAWTTSAGSLGSPMKSASVSYTVAATGDAPITYSVVSGALPSGLSLNSTSGVISGTTPNVGSATTYNFTIRASDAQNQDTDRSFSLAVQSANPPSTVEYLVVAGGGGGATLRGGGGGAGGYRTATGLSVSNGTPITVTVGAGGTAGTWSPGLYLGGDGTDSVFSTITSTGGGGGGHAQGGAGLTGGRYGGSGGGGADGSAGSSGVSGQGNSGGNGFSSAWSYTSGGGGGGAGASGSNGVSGAGGNGGTGLSSSITGSSVTYAGGGGGASQNAAGTGGSGGGASGVYPGNSGSANTGGGGGSCRDETQYTGTGQPGGAGGSGIVIIRYADTYSPATSTTGSPTYTTPTGYRVYKFTSSGSITF